MSKQINTHLFFHMNTDSSSSSKQKSSTNESSTTTRKPKKSSNLFSGYEIDNNPPLPSETGDYYDYYTNYGIPDYYGPMSPSSSPPCNNVYNNVDQYNYYDYRNQDYYDYYNQSGERDHSSDYRDTYATNNYGGGGGGGGSGGNYSGSNSYHSNHHHHQQQHPSSSRIDINQHGPSTSGGLYRGPTGGNTEYLQPPLISPPIQDSKRASPSFLNDGHYGNDPQGLSAISHKLHRITFVEACIFNPPDLLSPSSSGRPIGPPLPPPLPPPPPPPIPAIPPAPGRVGPPPVLAQGERSPTSTGGTQYYQEWTSKHKRHLCSRFEKPAQQQLLMNVERKSKYPFIILCTPDSRALSKSSSSASSTGKMVQRYRREISQQSAYSLDDELDDEEVGEEEEDEANWITQKQRDSINSHYLPPPPPPLLMPHIWPEIRYIDGLYTVCASIVRPGSGVADDYDELYLGQPPEMNNYENSNNSYPHHPRTTERHISFQESQTNSNCIPDQRPTGYIVSGFATFPGEDSERLEKNWLQWTGARVLYKNLPMCVGLRRLIFLKRCPDMYREDMVQSKIKPTIFTGFTYVLLCECYNLRGPYIASVCTTIDQLRARCCGYSALYLTHYQQSPPIQHHPHQHPHQQSIIESGNRQMMGHNHHHHHQQQPQHQHQHQHHHHHVPRHHRSTDFTEFDNL